MSIMDFWALDEPPRQPQIDALLWLEQNMDKKYLCCGLPVGTGKSAVGVTYANYVHSVYGGEQASFIMTPQKILQTQYEKSFIKNDSFKFMVSMYGQSNYKCHNKKTTCNIGSLLKPRCNNCPYQAVKKLAVEAKHVIFNYALALAMFQHTQSFTARDVLIFDECHNIENILVDCNNITLTMATCKNNSIKWLKSRDFVDVIEWIKDEYYPRMDDILEQLGMECEPLLLEPVSVLTKEDTNKLQKLHSMVEHLTLVHGFMMTDIDKLQRQYVLTHDKEIIKFKYLYGRYNFKKIFQPKAEKFLFMSATIFDPVDMGKCLGIPKEEIAYISIDSDFPAENRPVFFQPVMKMNYGWNDKDNKAARDRLIAAINKILINHHIDHGIIHTGNYQISQWLVEELTSNPTHKILHHNVGATDSRDTIIKLFLNAKEPTVLISPSITEGLDLIGDKARFAIFAKVPFGAMGDAWIKKRMAISNHWYMIRALTDIMQGCGRIVRSKDDWGCVYILDESWQYLYNTISPYIPKWWKDGYIK